MANHRFDQFRYSLEKQVVELWGTLTIGASGAVTLATGGGIQSITKEATAGQYSIVLDSKYYKFLQFSAVVVDDAISQIVNIQVLEDPAALQSDFMTDSTFKIQLLAATSVSVPTLIAANAADGAQILFRVTVRNTSVGVWD